MKYNIISVQDLEVGFKIVHQGKICMIEKIYSYISDRGIVRHLYLRTQRNVRFDIELYFDNEVYVINDI